MEPRPHPPATQRQPHRRSSHPDVILREPRYHSTPTAIRRIVGDERLRLGQQCPARCPAATATNSMAGRCRAFVQAPNNAWLDETCHFPSPGLRGEGFFFFKNPRTLTPSFPTDAGQLSVALTASIRRATRGLVGHQEGCQPRNTKSTTTFSRRVSTQNCFCLASFPFFAPGSQVL